MVDFKKLTTHKDTDMWIFDDDGKRFNVFMILTVIGIAFTLLLGTALAVVLMYVLLASV